MNIINYLQKFDNQYFTHCKNALIAKIDIIELDFSHGETDRTNLLFVEKGDLSFEAAIAMLTMRYKMHGEEWNDFAAYTQADIEPWIGFLEDDYQDTVYKNDVKVTTYIDDYMVKRIEKDTVVKDIFLNGKKISLAKYGKVNPLFQMIFQVSETQYKGLQTEYYIETSQHYALLHWFTTA